jgi:FMN-dependent NADH-azoreductase
MTALLDVHVLPRGKASRTGQLRGAFVESFLGAHPGTLRLDVDLARDHEVLPVFDQWDIQAKFEMAYGAGELGAQGAARWARLTRLTDQLHRADVLVVSAPMWNFTIPWHLKRWLDCVVQPRLTFEQDGEGFRGLLGGRKAVVLTTRDGAYGPGSGYEAFDFQMPYLRHILGFLGFDPIHVIVAEPLQFGGPEVGARALEDALERATELARSI